MKIEVNGSGIYRITGEDIQKAGVNPGTIDPATVRVFRQDTEIPVTASSTGGSFGASGTVEFYARGIDNQYTGTDVYWLYWGGEAGKRMAWSDGSISGSPPAVTTFKDLRTIEENHFIWAETPGAPESDYWFWEKFTSPQNVTFSFDLHGTVKNSADAAITVCFQGRTGNLSEASHHTIISVNGHRISDDTWQGGIPHVQTGIIKQDLINTGMNQIRIESLQDTGYPDIVYFNRIEVDYQRRLSADNDKLMFTLSQADPVQAKITGFSGQGVRIFDVTDPLAPRRVSNVDVQADASGFSAAFGHQGGEKTYLAVLSGKSAEPDGITFRKQSDLRKTSHQADYVLITGSEFMPALENLAELRRRQGLTVRMVDVSDIYDVFSFGLFDPEAIRTFLQHAYEKWSLPAPQYVLLAGDANLDYRHYYGTKKENIVPVYLDRTVELGLTPSDNRYGCVGGDDRVPELYVGRIPGDTVETVTGIVNKLIRYESTKHQESQSVLFVADDDDPSFEALNDNLAMYLPGRFMPQKIYTRFYENLNAATGDILGLIDSGTAMVNFVGHGDVTRWGAEPDGGGDFIIEPGDIDRLANRDRLTFVLALNCLNGYFSQPFQYCLAEEWVKAPDAGAVACFAPSGLSQQWEHEFLSNLLFSKIFLNSENRLGVLATESKIDAYYSGASDKVLVSFNLIGDPATRLAINRNPSDLVTVYTIMAESAAGGAISPAGEAIVFDRTNRTYVITPSAGYIISDVTVDGASKGAVETYTFNNITSDHTIRAAFEQEKSGGGGGGGGCFISSIVN